VGCQSIAEPVLSALLYKHSIQRIWALKAVANIDTKFNAKQAFRKKN
jgi:hypothetical protein